MTSRERRWLLAALVASLGIRLAVAGTAYLIRQDPAAFHVPDSARYLALARSMVDHGTFALDGRPEIYRLPGFPTLVAVATVAGAPTAGTLLIHAVLGVVITWLCFVAGRDIAGPRAGLWAATLHAIEPGQWAWSNIVATETLFAVFVIACFVAAARYLAETERRWLLVAVGAAAGAAYVRFIGYLLPAVLLLTVWSLGRWTAAPRTRQRVWRDVSIAALVAVSILGTWQVRNGLTADYWGFSIQLERAFFLMGGGTIDARQSGRSYTDTVRTLSLEHSASDASSQSSLSADAMRQDGIARVRAHPFMFASSYIGGIGTTLLHPGTAAVLRPFHAVNEWDDGRPSATQMITLGRWDQARAALAAKSPLYWLLTIPLMLINVCYLTACVTGAWKRWSHPAVRLACALMTYFVVFSGGPDGDSRRRVPLIPLMCVVAAAMGGWKTAGGKEAGRPQL